jgi:hypothetical protein
LAYTFGGSAIEYVVVAARRRVETMQPNVQRLVGTTLNGVAKDWGITFVFPDHPVSCIVAKRKL